MITRIIKHNDLKILDIEDYVLKFDGDSIKILDKNGIVTGGKIEDLRTKLSEIHNQSEAFFFENISINYLNNAMLFVKNQFEKYNSISLGMIYLDILGNNEKAPLLYRRYTSDYLLNNQPEVLFINSKQCPGIPTEIDKNLLIDFMQRTPILYYPGEYLQLV